MTTPDFDCTPTTCTGCTSAACVSRLDGATEPGAENAWPANAGEFAARWNARTAPQRDSWVQLMVATAQDAERCFVMNHAALMDENASLRAAVATARREGYQAALDDMSDGIRAALDPMTTREDEKR